jgi:hypothetical protein
LLKQHEKVFFAKLLTVYRNLVCFIGHSDNAQETGAIHSMNVEINSLFDNVIIFSAYSVIIFGINSLKSIAIFKIFTLVFFIHNVKM